MRGSVIALALAAGACDTGVKAIALGPLDANPACEEAKTHSDLAYIQANIFDRSCSSSTACHKVRTSDSANLQLSDGMSYTNLVGVDAQSAYATPASKGGMADHQWQRVVPGDPANSYLMVLIDPRTNPVPMGPSDPNGFDGPLNPKVGSMPQNAGELLCPEKIDAIKRWISAGAPDS
jgi:hypothetical protein